MTVNWNRIQAAQSNCQGNASLISYKNLAQANDRFSVQVFQAEPKTVSRARRSQK